MRSTSVLRRSKSLVGKMKLPEAQGASSLLPRLRGQDALGEARSGKRAGRGSGRVARHAQAAQLLGGSHFRVVEDGTAKFEEMVGKTGKRAHPRRGERVDRAPLGEGGVVNLWMSALGGEALYEQDMPDCCRCEARESRNSEDFFGCLSCGAVWQAAPTAESEECGFAERFAGRFEEHTDEERKGAA